MSFDEKRLAKPSDWADLDDDALELSMAELSSDVAAAFEEAKRELESEKAARNTTPKQSAGMTIIDTHVHLWSRSAGHSLPHWLVADPAMSEIAIDRSIDDYNVAAGSVSRSVYMEVAVAPEDRYREAEAAVKVGELKSNFYSLYYLPIVHFSTRKPVAFAALRRLIQPRVRRGDWCSNCGRNGC